MRDDEFSRACRSADLGWTVREDYRPRKRAVDGDRGICHRAGPGESSRTRA